MDRKLKGFEIITQFRLVVFIININIINFAEVEFLSSVIFDYCFSLL